MEEKEPASRRPSISAARGDESPAVKSRKNVAGTPTTPPRGGAALKAQLDSARYPAGRREQRRRVVTTQVVGTPHKVTARRTETTPPTPSTSLVKGRNMQSPLKRTASVAKKGRPGAALASPSPLRRAQTAADVVRPSDTEAESGSSLKRTPSKLRLRKKNTGPVTRTPANSPANSSESRVHGATTYE